MFFLFILFIFYYLKKNLNTSDIEKKLTKHMINHEFNDLFVNNEKKKLTQQ